jgi:hypothetical protein
VQRNSTELFHILFFQKKQNTRANAIVYKIKSNGLLVYVRKYGLRGKSRYLQKLFTVLGAVYVRDKDGNFIPPKVTKGEPIQDIQVQDEIQMMYLITKKEKGTTKKSCPIFHSLI